MLNITSAMNKIYFKEKTVETSSGNKYHGLEAMGETSAVVSRYSKAFYLLSLCHSGPRSLVKPDLGHLHHTQSLHNVQDG